MGWYQVTAVTEKGGRGMEVYSVWFVLHGRVLESSYTQSKGPKLKRGCIIWCKCDPCRHSKQPPVAIQQGQNLKSTMPHGCIPDHSPLPARSHWAQHS